MDTTQEVMFQKLLMILHRGFVQSRNLALDRNCAQLSELADTFEIVPVLMTKWKDEDLGFIRTILENYQSKYPGTGFDYLAILNMDDAEFQACYRLRQPESELPTGWE
jgi:hypothetical protein